MRVRYLTIPRNQKGLEEYNQGIEYSENLYVFELPEDEFDILYSSGVFGAINEECGLLIDDYESESIARKDFSKCISIIENVSGLPEPSVFREALKLASEEGIMFAMDF